ncbi:Uncharacterized protein dnm_096070 [Desulfonema magnum]|uniref:Uncharacterized protein n=1 Tax=Desulfonema magnum TaxID=45655 RepID=A0A975GTW9_9BACT|nr:Uncharacterized protein dnm_096070 [Desulfonema magnum]
MIGIRPKGQTRLSAGHRTFLTCQVRYKERDSQFYYGK